LWEKSRDHRRVKENAREHWEIFELLVECGTKIKNQTLFFFAEVWHLLRRKVNK